MHLRKNLEKQEELSTQTFSLMKFLHPSLKYAHFSISIQHFIVYVKTVKKVNLIKLLHRVVNRFVNCIGKTLVKLQGRCCCSSSRRKEVILIFYCSFGWCRWHSQLWGSGQLHQNWYLSLVASHIVCTLKVASPINTFLSARGKLLHSLRPKPCLKTAFILSLTKFERF